MAISPTIERHPLLEDAQQPGQTEQPQENDEAQAQEQSQDEAQTETQAQTNQRRKNAFMFPIFLAVHTASCIALTLALVFKVDGYNARDSSTPRMVSKKFRFHVADITTLISAGLVAIKFATASWATIAVWRCAYEVLHNTPTNLTTKQLSFMTRYKLPPWLRSPFGCPHGLRNWTVVLVLLLTFVQQFASPLLSGAVDWNASSVPGTSSVPVNSTSPTATQQYWYQYGVMQSERVSVLRKAAGYASIAWSDSATMFSNGTSSMGNGCRHIVNDDGLPANSTLVNSTVPSIKIHNISWATSSEQIPSKVAYLALAHARRLSIIDDTLYWYREPGHAVLYNSSKLWKKKESGLPDATLVSGTLSLGLVIGNNYSGCEELSTNKFGLVSALPQYKYSWGIGICMIFASVNLTAGETTSALSRYVSSRVVEDQTPIDDVVVRKSRWTQDALWALPDLMTSLVTMNSTLLSTWDNVDLYAKNLIRQSYVAAWDAFHRQYDADDLLVSYATPRESTLQAAVSKVRAFSWMAVSLLQTVGGILLIILFSRGANQPVPGDDNAGVMEQEKEQDAMQIVGLLFEGGFF